MRSVTRIDTAVRTRPANPLDAVHLSQHERQQAERDMRTAEQLVDFLFAGITRLQVLVRRLRGPRVAH